MRLTLRGLVLSRRQVRVLTTVPPGRDLAALRDLIESGQLTPVIDRTYPLERAPDAIRYVEVEHARAKVVVTVGE